tara:strand:+ start:2796 stop:3626 length:831 start_codon:yes stop_codon:yes gene_type:complete
MIKTSNSWLELNMIVSINDREIISGYFNQYTLGNHIEENSIKMYFESKDKDKVSLIVDRLKGIFSIEQIRWDKIQQENWMENWMENFHPVNISDKVMIIPDWDNNDYGSMYTVKIHPAMAFGTGHHASTQLMVENMINYNIGDYNSLLDLGCGSGILSFLSRKMGVNEITSIDVDPICKENFYKNAKLNSIDDINFSIDDVHEFQDYEFDVILANIDKSNIVKIINKYEQSNSNAILIIAGLLHKNKDEILSCLKKTYADSISKKDEWISIVIKRK